MFLGAYLGYATVAHRRVMFRIYYNSSQWGHIWDMPVAHSGDSLGHAVIATETHLGYDSSQHRHIWNVV